MWPMLKGTRALNENEYAVLMPAAVSLFTQLCTHHGNMDRTSILTGIPVFDKLTQERQMSSLYQATDSLIGTRSHPGEPHFYMDAAVGAIFSRVLAQILEEIENDETIEQRTTLLKAVGWLLREEGINIKSVEGDEQDWTYAVSLLFDYVLPNETYEDALTYHETDDSTKLIMSSDLGVDMEYFDLEPRDSAYKRWDYAFKFFEEHENELNCQQMEL